LTWGFVVPDRLRGPRVPYPCQIGTVGCGPAAQDPAPFRPGSDCPLAVQRATESRVRGRRPTRVAART
jgi:hypothetical protein